jgi:hypothetical protein
METQVPVINRRLTRGCIRQSDVQLQSMTMLKNLNQSTQVNRELDSNNMKESNLPVEEVNDQRISKWLIIL